MRKITTAILLTAALLAAPLAKAQTTNTIPSFLSQVETWATTVNTNYDWANVTLSLDSGYVQQSGTGAANFIRAEYYWGKLSIPVEGQFFGVGSQFNRVEAGIAYAAYKNHDFELGAELIGGYDHVKRSGVGEIGLFAKKMLTVNTFGRASLSQEFETHGSFNSIPVFRLSVGFLL